MKKPEGDGSAFDDTFDGRDAWSGLGLLFIFIHDVA